jgi:hypothetical protein
VGEGGAELGTADAGCGAELGAGVGVTVRVTGGATFAVVAALSRVGSGAAATVVVTDTTELGGATTRTGSATHWACGHADADHAPNTMPIRAPIPPEMTLPRVVAGFV